VKIFSVFLEIFVRSTLLKQYYIWSFKKDYCGKGNLALEVKKEK